MEDLCFSGTNCLTNLILITKTTNLELLEPPAGLETGQLPSY